MTKNTDFYEALRARITTWAATKSGSSHRWVDHLLLLPDMFHLLCALTMDREVPMKKKAQLGMVIAYIVSPVDLMPEAMLGPVGFIDDLALAAYAINQLMNEIDESIVLKHWKGDGDLLEMVRKLIATADEALGTGLWEKIKAVFSEGKA